MKTTEERREYFRAYNARRNKEASKRKCETCGTRAKRVQDIGCLNCYATAQPGWKHWTEPEKIILEIYAGKDDAVYLQLRIYQDTGSARTLYAIGQYYKTMGIKVCVHHDGYTSAQLSAITGHPRTSIKTRAKLEGLSNIGRGTRWLLSVEDGEKLIQYYKNIERPSYTIPEAMKILGYEQSSISNAIRLGLPSWRKGMGKRVCKVTVDRAAEYLKTTGKLRIHWRLLVSG